MFYLSPARAGGAQPMHGHHWEPLASPKKPQLHLSSFKVCFNQSSQQQLKTYLLITHLKILDYFPVKMKRKSMRWVTGMQTQIAVLPAELRPWNKACYGFWQGSGLSLNSLSGIVLHRPQREVLPGCYSEHTLKEQKGWSWNTNSATTCASEPPAHCLDRHWAPFSLAKK